jgi:hypothetical protein
MAALVLAACGEEAAPQRAATPTATPTPTATSTPAPDPTPARGECDEVDYKPVERGGTVHPGSNFFEPDATNLPSAADIDHLLLRDNAIVVLYAADSRRKTVERLSTWWYEEVKERTPIVVPDPSPDALPLRARIATIELRCNGVDFEALTKFANRTDIAPLPGHG